MAACLCVAPHAPYGPRRRASTHSLCTLLSKHALRALWPTPCTFGAPVNRMDMCPVIHAITAPSVSADVHPADPLYPNARPTSHKRSTDGIGPARVRLKVPRASCCRSPCVGRPWRRAHTCPLYTLCGKAILRALQAAPCAPSAPVLLVDVNVVVCGRSRALRHRQRLPHRNPSNPNRVPTSNGRFADCVQPLDALYRAHRASPRRPPHAV